MNDVDCMSCLVAVGRGLPGDGTFQDLSEGVTHATKKWRLLKVTDELVLGYVDVDALVCSLVSARDSDEIRRVPR